MFLKIILFIYILLFSACSQKENQLDTYKPIEIKNPEQIIDIQNKDTAEYKIQFTRTINNRIMKNLVFYINNLPYHQTFDLCEGYKNTIVTKIVQTDNNISTISDKTFDCYGEITVNNFNSDLLQIAYNLNFLIGFNTVKINTVDILLPVTRQISSSSFYKKNSSVDADTYDDYIKKISEKFSITVNQVKTNEKN